MQGLCSRRDRTPVDLFISDNSDSSCQVYLFLAAESDYYYFIEYSRIFSHGNIQNGRATYFYRNIGKTYIRKFECLSRNRFNGIITVYIGDYAFARFGILDGNTDQWFFICTVYHSPGNQAWPLCRRCIPGRLFPTLDDNTFVGYRIGDILPRKYMAEYCTYGFIFS